MLSLRQQARGLALLAQQLAQQQPAGGSLAAAPAWLWQLQAAAALHGSRSAAAISDPLTGITKWLAQRMPTALGGIGEGDLDLESELGCCWSPALACCWLAWLAAPAACCTHTSGCASAASTYPCSLCLNHHQRAAYGRPHRVHARHRRRQGQLGAGGDAHV